MSYNHGVRCTTFNEWFDLANPTIAIALAITAVRAVCIVVLSAILVEAYFAGAEGHFWLELATLAKWRALEEYLHCLWQAMNAHAWVLFEVTITDLVQWPSAYKYDRW